MKEDLALSESPGSVWTASASFESGFWRKGPVEMIAVNREANNVEGDHSDP